ncbi:hypothetical protein CFC21_049140 [Triticum aestivum]|uniref:Acetyltransferase n=2 Tax=Triticum aestivum TaxID=4565 RepID=A0A9R1G2P0_WHEAT|nr:hypothetical protein CFC21_049140 [Triticum aestivum]
MEASAVRQRNMEASSADTVRIVSRRMVRPSHGAMPVQPSEDIHLTPWDLCCIGMEYIQRGVLLSKPTAGGEMSCLVDTLASSLARALGRYYHLAGRLAVEEHGDRTIIVPLRCTGEGAELVHAAAPGVAVADIVGSVYTPSPVVWGFFPLNGLRGADAAIVSLPVLWAQVTELADDIFIGMSMNHSVGDGTSFSELFNAWSAINRGDKRMGEMVSTPARVHRRWFVDTSPVPIPFPFSKLQDVVQRFELPPVREGFFSFSAASVKKLKARANDEMAAGAAISSLQALLAHLWRAVSRARRLPPVQETLCAVTVGCRGRMRGIPADYLGNAIEIRVAGCTVGEILDNGLGWTAWQLNSVVGSFDEAGVQELKKLMEEANDGTLTPMLAAAAPRSSSRCRSSARCTVAPAAAPRPGEAAPAAARQLGGPARQLPLQVVGPARRLPLQLLGPGRRLPLQLGGPPR